MYQNITPEDRKRLAAQVGINEQYLYQCLSGRRDMRATEAMRVERETAGVLTRLMLCQRTHALIWPELRATVRTLHESQATVSTATPTSTQPAMTGGLQ